jgi:hypothetical protein
MSYWRQTTTISNGTSIDPSAGAGRGRGGTISSSDRSDRDGGSDPREKPEPDDGAAPADAKPSGVPDVEVSAGAALELSPDGMLQLAFFPVAAALVSEPGGTPKLEVLPVPSLSRLKLGGMAAVAVIPESADVVLERSGAAAVALFPAIEAMASGLEGVAERALDPAASRGLSVCLEPRPAFPLELSAFLKWLEDAPEAGFVPAKAGVPSTAGRRDPAAMSALAVRGGTSVLSCPVPRLGMGQPPLGPAPSAWSGASDPMAAGPGVARSLQPPLPSEVEPRCSNEPGARPI